MIRKALEVLLKWALGQITGKLKIAKKAFWLGAIVGAVAGGCVGSFLTYLLMAYVAG